MPSFICPDCKMESHNPNDVREGYCGNCHNWTGRPDAQVDDEMAENLGPHEETLEDFLEEVRTRKVIPIAFRSCPECGTTVACLWTPDGTESPKGCADHGSHSHRRRTRKEPTS